MINVALGSPINHQPQRIGVGFSYDKQAANETSVVRDLERLSTVWRVVVSEPGLSLSSKGLANVNATTELSCAREPRAPRAASWTCTPVIIDRRIM